MLSDKAPGFPNGAIPPNLDVSPNQGYPFGDRHGILSAIFGSPYVGKRPYRGVSNVRGTNSEHVVE